MTVCRGPLQIEVKDYCKVALGRNTQAAEVLAGLGSRRKCRPGCKNLTDARTHPDIYSLRQRLPARLEQSRQGKRDTF